MHVKPHFTTILQCCLLLVFWSLNAAAQKDEWTNLLDENLSRWENYLSYQHDTSYNGDVPLDDNGQPITPVGLNNDTLGIFTTLQKDDALVLKVSGRYYGCVFTKQAYKNYHLSLKVKWGTKKYVPRKAKLMDSGILYHSIGEPGAEYWRTWMLSQEFQIMEGHNGDYWSQATSAIDIRSYPPENSINAVADAGQPFRAYGYNADNGNFCLRSANHESPKGEWTTLELICFNGKSLHIVNGNVVMVLQNSRYIKDGEVLPLEKGKIQLQSEAAEVYFKDIRIKPINEMPPRYSSLF